MTKCSDLPTDATCVRRPPTLSGRRGIWSALRAACCVLPDRDTDPDSMRSARSRNHQASDSASVERCGSVGCGVAQACAIRTTVSRGSELATNGMNLRSLALSLRSTGVPVSPGLFTTKYSKRTKGMQSDRLRHTPVRVRNHTVFLMTFDATSRLSCLSSISWFKS